jgi:CheY-like chemotaxis protein
MLISPSNARPILAAEDEETDALILRRVFKKAGLPNELIIAADGQETVEYLTGVGHYADRSRHPLPCLLLLDLKMPRMNGFDVLAWLSQNPEFNDLPVVVLSSSSHESDIKKAREMGAWDYQIKPHSMEELGRVIQNVISRWLLNRNPGT